MNDLFIEPEINISKTKRKNASYLRKEFELGAPVKKAVIILSACGIYKAYLNGGEIDKQVLLPGFTNYKERLQFQKYDVTHLLQQKKNVIAAIVGDGWYRGSIGVLNKTNYYGSKTKFLCVLDITYRDGTKKKITTDLSWKATQNGPILKNDLKLGEEYDATLEMPGWNTPGFDDLNWHGVLASDYNGKLVPTQGEKIIEHERFRPEVLQTPDGSTVLDFGQNMSGYVQFKVEGSTGQKVRLIHGETLDEKGNFTLKNINLEGTAKKNEPAGQTIDYTLKDGLQEYKPIFTIHGFQYVKLENWPEDVKPDNFQAVAVYSDLNETGRFECSHDLINQLVSNVEWSQKSNFVDIPTDCPTRERAGWTGDILIFSETASYLMHTDLFLKKWLKDVSNQQHEDGRIPSIVPDVGLPSFFDGSAGWADVIAVVPYLLYNFYKDKEILEEHYNSIVKWVEFQIKRAEKSHLTNKLKSGAYRKYIVDTGYHWGEWLEPGHVMLKDIIRNIIKPDSEVATAYFAYSVNILSKIAYILDKTEDHKKYSELYKKICSAYQKEFLKSGQVISDRQCRYVRPVALDLVNEEQKKMIVKDLNQMIVDNDYRINTGFLTTPDVLKVLSEYGYVETAYRMLENTKRPGWLYQVTKGATTIWENWNGKDENNVPVDSQNHYAPGSVVAWLFNTVAGIQPAAPGFEKIRIAPVPGGSLEFVNCTYESFAGEIRSSWKISNNTFELKVSVPVEAEVVMPDGEKYRIEAGEYTFICPYRNNIL